MSMITDDFMFIFDEDELNRITFSDGHDPEEEKKKRVHSADPPTVGQLPGIDVNMKEKSINRLRSKSMIVTQLVKVRRRAATVVSRHELEFNEEDMATSCTIYDFLLIAVFITCVVLGTLFVITALQPAEPELLNLGEEFRSSNSSYIGLFFLTEPSTDALQAFDDASTRWSRILAGSETLLPGTLRSVACDFEFNPSLLLDHLNIIVSIEEIDGELDILGSAGPCAFHNNIPTVGTMILDSADIDAFAASGQLNSVILHEMGHVLGIGTLWTTFGFIENALPDSLPNLNLPSPTYTGAKGKAEFQLLTGSNSSELGIEDGFDGDVANGAAEGAVNGHFDIDSMETELMTFIIRATEQSLSIVTIRCLEDFGYTVAIDEADPFELNSVGRILVEANDIIMKNDMIDPTPFLEAEYY